MQPTWKSILIFQSLSGSLSHLDSTLVACSVACKIISIPVGQPQPFRQHLLYSFTLLLFVISIPVGQPQPFRHTDVVTEEMHAILFQSLSGSLSHLDLCKRL